MINRTSLLNQPNKITCFDNILQLQKKYQSDLIYGNSRKQLIWMGEHKLCYTIGKGGNPNNILSNLDQEKYKVLKINRGGEVTCHLPGQLVVYLVLDLNNFNKDLNWYLRTIETIIISLLSKFDIESHAKDGFTGVWCGDKKIASVGIGCKRWVTIHGFSLNVDCNIEHFNKIIPCGIKGCSMTKISDFRPEINIGHVKPIVKKTIQEHLNINFISE